MPVFIYKARTQEGKTEKGTIDAAAQDEAVSSLQGKGLVILSIKKSAADAKKASVYRQKLHSRIKSKDLILFTTQLASTVKANIPLLKCLEIQIQQTQSRRLKHILEDIRDHIRQGDTLKNSMARHPKIFGPLWLNLIETGETSGKLPAILKHLAGYLYARNELRRKAVTALIYPALLVSICILAIYIFTIRVIPIFAGIFADFNMTLPLITRAVIGMSDFLRRNILMTFVITGAAVFAFSRYIKTAHGKRTLDIISFKLPIFGTFLLNSAIEKFSSSLGLLLRSGVPMLEALEITTRTNGNTVMEDILKKAYADIRDGKPLSASLSKSRLFPPLTINMCSIGEETGELDKMLKEITDYYRGELNVFVERLSAVIEPFVIIIMGGFVFILVIAMYLPIFRLSLLGRHH